MTIKAGSEIEQAGVFEPFTQRVNAGASYGCGAAGYDIRLDSRFLIQQARTERVHGEKRRRRPDAVYDPMILYAEDLAWTSVESKTLTLSPGQFVLGQSLETIKVPATWLGLCVGKSTWARGGLLLNTTPLEPGWSGKLTLEIHNISAREVRLTAGIGIAQILFWENALITPGDSYAARGGRYQGQTEPTPGRTP